MVGFDRKPAMTLLAASGRRPPGNPRAHHMTSSDPTCQAARLQHAWSPVKASRRQQQATNNQIPKTAGTRQSILCVPQGLPEPIPYLVLRRGGRHPAVQTNPFGYWTLWAPVPSVFLSCFIPTSEKAAGIAPPVRYLLIPIISLLFCRPRPRTVCPGPADLKRTIIYIRWRPGRQPPGWGCPQPIEYESRSSLGETLSCSSRTTPTPVSTAPRPTRLVRSTIYLLLSTYVESNQPRRRFPVSTLSGERTPNAFLH
ncbi:hypothetical protein BO70DRAFT_8426 [Aspergillus heteromorphus CBS 117.55]|uniref:Uncharacterized protein n=1 Tax=Aspergillus heteromorphus CBS 117.55 TaxID=1448321 RepID=A0A317X137_9EURO|nr:uncharacterized protein BO70DRAFT_8426 [Aspergillus heteromorphus CBS 117.55]PWY92379.1 hypothetical protein BO70DRAFT_8426 [Aspergillus heteromorphus CBS 117.55]